MRALMREALGEFMDSLGHVLGSCLIRPDRNLCAVNIPRVASSTLKKNLSEEGFVYHSGGTFTKPTGWECFAVLRDPYDRFVSGLAEIFRRQDLSYHDMDHYCHEYVFHMTTYRSIPITDAHVAPQHLFLPPWLAVDQYFQLDQLGQLDHWLAERGVNSHLTTTWENVTPDPVRTLVNAYCEPIKEIIYSVYHVDNTLYQAVRGRVSSTRD